ncbi:hypothetical protein [Lactococcus lactis]|uniref:hypothetical protein n=1 Tax=Lactococcus lactis TaxID=1358 RepID=UPI00241650C4|nr:hypothetical protein [Lactococcus lactis]MDG4970025.1 hypothetical protein [Lactococcus lactis]MDG5103883.1 hypothetical protein [Lactococcus lactis]
MSELEEFKKVVSPIAYGLAYKSKLGTTEYQQLYADGDVIKYFNNKPQLTIPKIIADELDGFNPNEGETKIAVLIEGYNECFISDELMQFCLVDNNLNLCVLYLAGKALGVDLVRVVEG